MLARAAADNPSSLHSPFSYDAFLSRHGGMSNAYTELENTVYYFDCRPAALSGALDRLAQFFVAPLIKADALGREVLAVDNEFTGVSQSDSCRLGQLRCDTAVGGHPYGRFFWGNKRSLADAPAAAGVDVRAAVVDFHARLYSAERMSLVVLGGDGLDELQRDVVAGFGAVAAGAGPAPAFKDAGAPYAPGALHVLPAVKEGHALHISFCLPDLTARYRAKAEDYVSHLVGHEGAGSLLAALKARGWATGLCAGVGEGGVERSSAAYVFDVAVTLTDAGLAARVDAKGGAATAKADAADAALPPSGLAVASLLFQTLAALRQAGPQRWVHDEVAAVARARFRWAEEEDAADYASRLAPAMPHHAPEHALSGPFLHDDWDEGLVASVLGAMTPTTARLDLCTSAAAGAQGLSPWAAASGATSATEQWFGFDYVSVPLPDAVIRAWEAGAASPAPDLALPRRNPFIPTDFALRCEEEQEATDGGGKRAKGDGGGADAGLIVPLCPPPSLALDEPGLRLWHKTDTNFRVPRAALHAAIAPAGAGASPAAAAAAHAALRLWDDALCERAYLADVAGLSVDGWPEGTAGVELRVDGFSHRLPDLAREAVAALAALSVDPAAFARVREGLAREYRNAHVRPDRQAAWLRLACLKRLWAPERVLAELESLTPETLTAALPSLFANNHVELLVQGNIGRGEAAALARAARAALPGPPLAAAARPYDPVTALPPGSSTLLRAPVKNAAERNAVVEVYLQLGPDTPPARAALDLAAHAAHEPAYNVLRTQEQLGYAVHAGARCTHGVLGFAVVVASGEHGPAAIDARVDAFLSSFVDTLATMPDAALEAHRAALAAAKRAADTSLADEAARHWDRVSARAYDFDARERELAALPGVGRGDLVALWRDCVAPGGAARRRLAVHVVPPQHAAELAAPAPAGALLVASPDEVRAAHPAHASRVAAGEERAAAAARAAGLKSERDCAFFPTSLSLSPPPSAGRHGARLHPADRPRARPSLPRPPPATACRPDPPERRARPRARPRAAPPPPHFFLAAALVTLPAPSFFSTDLMTPTATVWRMSRTAKRPSGG